MRLMLNNKPLFQIGPLDQGWWPDGLLTPPSDEAMKYDLEVLKKLGFNMLRKHIKVEPARLYYHCDKLGPARLAGHAQRRWPQAAGSSSSRTAKEDAEFTDEEKKQFRTELKAMIDHLRFFPCIVVWVPFNEGWGQHDTNDILKWVKEYDPTRLVNGPSGWTDRGYGDMKDMHSYPGPGMFPVMPDRVSVLGEFGGLGLPLKGHLWKDTENWGYRTFKTTEELRDNYRAADAPAAPADRQGARGRGLHADDRRRGRGQRPADLRPRGDQVRRRRRRRSGTRRCSARRRSSASWSPTSEKAAQKWRYTTDEAGRRVGEAGLRRRAVDARATAGSARRARRARSSAPSGRRPTSGSAAAFELKEVPKGEVLLRIHHDEDAEVYINGVLAAKVVGYTTDYVEVPLTAEGRKALEGGHEHDRRPLPADRRRAVHRRGAGGGGGEK